MGGEGPGDAFLEELRLGKVMRRAPSCARDSGREKCKAHIGSSE